MHHAKSDVSYSRLQRVCVEVEATHPTAKAKARGNADLRALESTPALPPHLAPDADPPCAFPSARTERVEAALGLLGEDPAAAVAGVAGAVLDSALHCCTTADRGLLRDIHKGMRQRKADERVLGAPHPLPTKDWAASVLSEEAAERLRDHALGGKIRAEVQKAARAVGGAMAAFETQTQTQAAAGGGGGGGEPGSHSGGAPQRVAAGDAIRERYLEFFTSAADVFVPPEQQAAFAERWRRKATKVKAKATEAPAAEGRAEMLRRLRAHLESPLPSNFLRSNPTLQGYGTGSERKTRRRVSELLFGPRVAASPRL
jgi:hypothetical protein